MSSNSGQSTLLATLGNIGSIIQGTPVAWGLATSGITFTLASIKTVPLAIALGIVGAVMIAASIASFWVAAKRRRYFGEIQNNNPDWIVLSDHRVAYIRSRAETVYDYHFRLKAKRKIEVFRETFRWSGIGEFIVTSPSTGVLVVQYPSSIGRRLFGFVTPSPIERNEVFDLRINVVAKSTAKETDPFFSVTPPAARGGNDNYIMVKFSEKVGIKSVWRQIFRDGSDWPHKNEEQSVDDTRCIKIDYASSDGARHAIVWEYED